MSASPPSSFYCVPASADEDLLTIAPPQTSDLSANDISVDVGSDVKVQEDVNPADDERQLSASTRDNTELALVRQRDWLRYINQLLEDAASDFEALPSKFDRITNTCHTSHSLLDLYSKILTQAEHTHSLLRDPSWLGLTKDRENAAAQQKALEEAAALECLRVQEVARAVANKSAPTESSDLLESTNVNKSSRGQSGRGQRRGSSVPPSRIGRVRGRGRRPT